MYRVPKSVLSRFYFPDRPCIDPVFRLLKLFGLWRRNRSIYKTIFVSCSLIFFNIFLFSVIAKLIIHFNYYLLMEFIQQSPYYLCVYTLTIMFFQHQQWEKVVHFIINIEKESCKDKTTVYTAIVYKYKNYSQFIIYAYYSIFVPILIFFFLSYWFNNVMVPCFKKTNEPFVSAYYLLMPFDQNVHRFWSASIQTLFGLTVSIGMWTWETFLLSSAMFFIGQLKSLRARCVDAIVAHDEDLSYKNIIACHQQYVNVLRCKKIFNSLMAWVSFPQLLQMSIVCGVCIIKVVLEKDDPAVVTKSITIFIGLNMQWALFYGIANEVIVHSENLSYGIFESSWVSSSVRVRRAVLLLSVGMRQRVAFSAGPFNEMSLETLSLIWRTTYSIYAVLSQSVQE